jgi:hypothetical protein
VAGEEAQAVRGDRRTLTLTLIVVSGAPGTGKSTIAGATEVFCRCDPRLASDRAAARIGHGRHPIHRDVINPAMADRVGLLAASVTPLRLGAALVEVDTGTPGASGRAVTAVRAVLD